MEPFKRMAIGLVGPFDPMSERGHRYSLMIVDMASRFPEAVPLKRIDTPAIAETLSSAVFVVFPEWIVLQIVALSLHLI